MGQNISNEIRGEVSVQIALSSSSYSAGNVVQGYLEVNVQKAQQDIEIAVELLCNCRTTVGYTSGSGKNRSRRTAVSNTALHRQDAIVLPRQASLAYGFHRYNFSFALPGNAPSTMRRYVSGRDSAEISYFIGVAIKRHGWFKRNLVHRVGFDVYGTPPQSITTNPNATKSFPITTCCCWDSGSIDLDVTTDSSAYRNGSMIDVTHRINNTASTADVDSAFVSVVEILDLHARGHRTRVYRVLQQQPLAVPAGPNASPRSSFLVPNNFGCTITSKTLTIRHVVRLYVRTAGCCVSDPVLDSPVELFMVGPGSGVAVATVIPEIVVGARDDEVIPVATTIPYDTAVAASAPPVVKGIPLDTTGDGVTDSWGYDTTGDGKIDALDTTMDGKIDTAGVSLQYETMQTGK